MAFKCIIVLAFAAVASAGVVPVAPAAPVLAKLEHFDAVPQYSFAYDVQDSLTGDSKAQYEVRNGDVVQGSYSLIEADGTRRIVDYTADPINGFNAVVNREPAIAVAPVVAKAAAPVVAAPVAARIAAPVVAAPAPVAVAPVARAFAGPAPVAVAPVAGAFAAPAPVAVAPVARAFATPVPYTLPRAVATRFAAPLINSVPLTYAAPALL